MFELFINADCGKFNYRFIFVEFSILYRYIFVNVEFIPKNIKILCIKENFDNYKFIIFFSYIRFTVLLFIYDVCRCGLYAGNQVCNCEIMNN